MYKLSNIKMEVGFNEQSLLKKVQQQVGAIENLKIIKQSLDARRKSEIHYVLTVAFNGSSKLPYEEYIEPKRKVEDLLQEPNKKQFKLSPLIIGSGPAGLFAGLLLAVAGANPIIIERGESIENRQKSVITFNKTGILNTSSNIQFGEGGAGTFSDGKLNTGISGDLISVVLGEFVKAGASPEIEFSNRPHIGTDKLKLVVAKIRDKIISYGGSYLFNTVAEDFIIENGKITAVIANGQTIKTDNVILACGHSARDTYKMLQKCGVKMERKPFAIGARIEHTQKMIDLSQYGKQDISLPPADYKLSHKTTNGRGCFTFCMCPGGYVVAGASEMNGVVTNGMSELARDGKFANSAVLVNVYPEDFGSGDELKGIDFQRVWEQKAFKCGTNYEAPSMSVKDFINGKITQDVKKFNPTYSRGVVNADLSEYLPDFVINSMKEGLKAFNNKLNGFAQSGILVGVETRSSAPVTILRNELGEANLRGLFPCGEGAGYAGGITSSAVDGLRTAINLLKI